MKRFLGVCVIWFVLLLICFMLFGNYLMSNFYVILLAVSLLLAIFTCVLISQSDAIETLENALTLWKENHSLIQVKKERTDCSLSHLPASPASKNPGIFKESPGISVCQKTFQNPRISV